MPPKKFIPPEDQAEQANEPTFAVRSLDYYSNGAIGTRGIAANWKRNEIRRVTRGELQQLQRDFARNFERVIE